MSPRIRMTRQASFGLTTLQLHSDELDVEVRVLSKQDGRKRRAIVRSFITQIGPWIRGFDYRAIGHANHGSILDRRDIGRGIKPANAVSTGTLSGATGFQVKMRRLELGLSQSELAKLLNIQRSHLSEIERGIHFPSPTTRDALMRVLDLPIN